ncbi:PREDICTED: peptidoglycan-recognition protein SC2-like isoform X2 [Branchiostoma belcheri]|uniref:Peptidoglycan-recognition protein SC2-like isoform X2 n=1 Tax=Branchiostoma belcheri TaxID=7741 RepID=A0A6P5APJ1_BRABE|nr:PREDICTED: peptidoglycan-recognition protein SC2-like isoform X2 [Branchiostoma belcheri]
MLAFLVLAVLSLAVPSYGLDDSGCAALGGTCTDYRYTTCKAGYVTNKCAGDTYRRCCLNCDATCQALESSYATYDSSCAASGGTCKVTSNYCSGSYVSGKCGGPSDRKCCVPSSGGGGSNSIGLSYSSCAGVNMVLRDGWGARPPKYTNAMHTPVSQVFIHHTTGSACYDQDRCSSLIRSHQNYHMDNRGWADIGYNFLIGEDGRVYEGRGFDRQGGHTQGYNSVSIAVSFVGDYTSRLPNQAALNAAKAIIDCGVQLGKVTSGYRLKGHRDVGSTACPGDTLYSHIRTWSHYS